MRKGFRPSLEPPTHRRLPLETARRPACCLVLTSGVVTFLFVVFAISGWNVYSHHFSGTGHVYHDGDQVAMTGNAVDFSSIFCDAYTISLDDPGMVYLLAHHAVVNESQTVTESLAIQQPEGLHYTAREFYLLRGSTLEVRACHDKGSRSAYWDDAELFFIKGESNFEEWRHDRFCRGCILRKLTIPPRAPCLDRPATFHLSISDTDRYTLVAHYFRREDHGRVREGQEGTTHVNATLTRTRYQLTATRSICALLGDGDVKDCRFDLPWNADYDVIVDFGLDRKSKHAGFADPRREFHTRCHVRLAFWISVFGLVPLVLAFPVASCFAWFLCRRRTVTTSGQVKRPRGQAEIRVQDDACLAHNEVAQHVEEDSRMAIQDG